MINWKQIPNSNIYYASECGKIGSKYIKGTRSKFGDEIFELKFHTNRGGYFGVHLYEHGKRKTVAVHQLIAETFLGPCENRYVNHKDLNRQNNNISNLEYVTPKENYWHSRKLGNFSLPPRNSHMRKLNKEQVFEILSSKFGCDILGRQYNIQPSTIVKIRSGKSYSDWYNEFHSKV
jgi:hypothetical protein